MALATSPPYALMSLWRTLSERNTLRVTLSNGGRTAPCTIEKAVHTVSRKQSATREPADYSSSDTPSSCRL